MSSGGKRKQKFDETLYAVAVAWLRSQGHTQKQIGEQLQINQSVVSRLLSGDEAKRWLELQAPRFVNADNDVWERVEAKFFSSKNVYEKLKASGPNGASVLRKVTVVPTAPHGGFGPSVVHTLTDLLSRVGVVGVAWGRSVNRLVTLVEELVAGNTSPPRLQSPIRFIPLCGEPLKRRIDPVTFSSSALAMRLSEIFNGGQYTKEDPPPSLAGVPTFIPLQFKKREEVETIRRFIRLVTGYTTVFGDVDEDVQKTMPLVDHLEAILTSVGVVRGDFTGSFLAERVQLGDLTEDELERWVVGDLCGVMIPRDGLNRSPSHRIEEMNERWTGIKRRHIENCAKQAFESDRPGVVVIAMGRDRREIVQRCVQLNLINEVIMDPKAAQSISMH